MKKLLVMTERGTLENLKHVLCRLLEVFPRICFYFLVKRYQVFSFGYYCTFFSF